MARADAYGTPETLFARIAARWSLTLFGRLTAPLEARDVALLMLDMKQERAIAGKTEDTWADIAGYAACAAENRRGEDRGGGMSLSRHDQASAVAREHIRWAQKSNVTPRDIIEGLGAEAPNIPTWDAAFAAVAMAWLDLGSAKYEQREAA